VRPRLLIPILAVAAVLGLLAYGLLSKGSARLAIGDPAPGRTLTVLGGKQTRTLPSYRGRWALVNLWASWCGPCHKEAPGLESFYRHHGGRRLIVVGVNVQDNEEDALAFVREFRPTYPELRSVGDALSEDFGSTGVPENFLFNPRGRLAAFWAGPVDEQILEEQALPLIEGRG
jgi:cytochrome c biogenesis protein CcmG/thiol:disulfide interchange protein DsbE